MPDDGIAALQGKLRECLSALPKLMQELQAESALFAYDWEIQDRLRSTSYSSHNVTRAITLVLDDPVARIDINCLRELDNAALSIAQTAAFASLLITAKRVYQRENIDVVIKGPWALNEQLPINGKLQERIGALLQALGKCMTHITQMRKPELYPWNAHRTPQEISHLIHSAKALETELNMHLSANASTICYGRYLLLETILASYEHFEAYTLKKFWTH